MKKRIVPLNIGPNIRWHEPTFPEWRPRLPVAKKADMLYWGKLKEENVQLELWDGVNDDTNDFKF